MPVWARAHSQHVGPEWYGMPSGFPPEVLEVYPGLRALTERQTDLLLVKGIRVPGPKGTFELRQEVNRAHGAEGRSVCVLPSGLIYLMHRVRFALGCEALNLQSIHYGPQNHKLLTLPSKQLHDLAGNAFHCACSSAVTLVGWILRSRILQASRARLSSPARSICTIDDILDVDDDDILSLMGS